MPYVRNPLILLPSDFVKWGTAPSDTLIWTHLRRQFGYVFGSQLGVLVHDQHPPNPIWPPLFEPPEFDCEGGALKSYRYLCPALGAGPVETLNAISGDQADHDDD
jgi:hypothetical protein